MDRDNRISWVQQSGTESFPEICDDSIFSIPEQKELQFVYGGQQFGYHHFHFKKKPLSHVVDQLAMRVNGRLFIHVWDREYEPTSRIINNGDAISYWHHLMDDALNHNATDIHLDPCDGCVIVKRRIDGLLRELDRISTEQGELLKNAIKVRAKMDVSNQRLPQDGKLTYAYGDSEIDARIATIPTLFGEKMVIRLLHYQEQRLSLSQLGIDQQLEKELIKLLKHQSGALLIVGPTGEGKTTTAYALLNHLNLQNINLMTLEDPVEYTIYGANQMEVNEGIGLSFHRGLRSILRLDPDVLFVGETRDSVTAQTMIQAGITGQLVVTTLHASNSIMAIFRLLDMGVERYQLKSSVVGILSQRLVGILCEDCKIQDDEGTVAMGFPVYKPQGCEKCQDGYLRRKALYEYLPMTRDFVAEIHGHSHYNQLLEVAKTLVHYQPLEEQAKALLEQGIISMNDYERVKLSMRES